MPAPIGRGATIATSRRPVPEEPGAAASPGRDWALLVGALGGALGAALLLGSMIRPFETGPVGFDSAGSVLHFDRIAAGQRLEAFVTVTPKPLLTVVYGLLHAVVADWRVVSVAAIVAFGFGVALAVWLVGRAVPGAPRWAAIVATPVLLVSSPRLLLDVSLAYAVPWALTWWLVAGIAVLGPRPRPWLLGLALMLATLARLETVAVSAVLGLALVVEAVRSAGGSPSRTWTVRSLAVATGLAAMALPLMLLHDWLLTGNPWFWLSVSAAFSDASTVIPSPGAVLDTVIAIGRIRPLPLLAAVVGLALLWRRGQRPLVLGLIALGPGLGALLVGLAARGTYVSARYYAGIEVAVMVAAALGVAAIAAEVTRRTASWRPGRSGSSVALGAAGVAAVLAGVVLAGPFAPRSRTVLATMRDQAALARIGDGAEPLVGPLLAGHGLAPGEPRPGDASPWLYVPGLLRPRLAVDLGLPLWAVAGISPSILGPSPDLRAGAVILHSGVFDAPAGAYAALETGGAVTLAGRRADTVGVVDGDAWVLIAR